MAMGKRPVSTRKISRFHPPGEFSAPTKQGTSRTRVCQDFQLSRPAARATGSLPHLGIRACGVDRRTEKDAPRSASGPAIGLRLLSHQCAVVRPARPAPPLYAGLVGTRAAPGALWDADSVVPGSLADRIEDLLPRE